LLIAAVFSLVAWAGLCESCRAVRLSLPVPIEPIGALIYGALSLWLCFRELTARIYAVIAALAGAQLVLAGYLLQTGQNCGVCVIVLAGVLLAAIEGWLWKKPDWFLPTLALFGGMLVGLGILKVHQQHAVWEQAAWKREIAAELRERGEPLERTVFILTDPGCHYCEAFARETLPGLKIRFAGAVEFREVELKSKCPVPALYVPAADGLEDLLVIGKREEREVASILRKRGYAER